ncbi:DNA polymerase III subunit delta' [uncultured Cohaesibacter sp.]|uniref:DNA polymerase III subunit delta' n=1 Tax=uncultured Cohaesibacter sp. TaxID=1002546 RepID=UPI00292D4055|nr:DNA polymerase III subunit delta' [uncultured Cohaesibacter sp.]
MAQSDQDIQIFDSIENLAPPHMQRLFFGHKAEEKRLLSSWNSGKMHHAWLLTGPKGIGKATFAFRAARFIFNEGGKKDAISLLEDAAPTSLDCPEDSHSNHLINNLAHPNLLVIDRPYDEKAKKFKTEITVDEVRKTVKFFGSTAGEGTWRVCIVDPADDLNSNAANALLKILEEPPKRTVFFLISHAPGRLLPTIRSRCRRLSFSPLAGKDLSDAIQGLEIADGETLTHLSKSCAGSIRKAAELQSNEGLVLIHTFERLLAPPHNPDYDSLNNFADLVAQRGKEERIDNFSDLVHGYLSHQLHQQSRKANADVKNLNALADAWEEAREMLQQTRIFNLDKKQTVIEIVRMLAKASKAS